MGQALLHRQHEASEGTLRVLHLLGLLKSRQRTGFIAHFVLRNLGIAL